jgi:C-terminal processing protease CtpA/Prc
MVTAYPHTQATMVLATSLIILAGPSAALAQDRWPLPRPLVLVVEVTAVEPSGPASRAGLEVGDRILEVDGVAVRSLPELRRLLHAAGDSARLTVRQRRTGKGASVHVYPEGGRIGIDARMVVASPESPYPY